MANKVIFVAFAIEDEGARNLLKGQSILTKSPFEYVDMSVKEAYDTGWKDKVRTRIRRSDGVIALISKNSITSSGQQWEVQCAREEKKPILGMWAYAADRSKPAALASLQIIEWDWPALADFINRLP